MLIFSTYVSEDSKLCPVYFNISALYALPAMLIFVLIFQLIFCHFFISD